MLPFRLNYYDAMGIHGANERIRVDWFVEGVETVKQIVREAVFEGKPGAPTKP